ncbi:hypothetical protein FQA39_LY18296 [Lamprigera yunnana]|nr:hypothetical protein FQA39_LY18296 [Lamprigera yunnana]
MWTLYAEQHWTKAINLKSTVENLYENLGALELDADHEAIYGMEIITRFNNVINIRLEGNKSDTSDEEEYKTVEQNGEGSETTKEEKLKKSKGERITKPVL